MLETRAIVVSADGQRAVVEADQGNGCGQCSGKGCGAGKLSQLFCNSPRQFQVDNPIEAGIGDEVIVSVAQGAVMRGIIMLYGFPLVLLVVFASFGSVLGGGGSHSDAYAALGALFGLVAGFVLARLVAVRQGGRLARPFIARRWSGDEL